ncbi:MAG: hypothetical protein F4098_05605 [Acidimicrobiaceae bacterium]|nr:hypothetical protein [Acidimicrobiaceae bacterium]MYI58122.1 hypothetical protein [Acidimicrobiaceae bacterium]
MRTDVRRIAVDAVVRIETEGAYANVLLPKMLARADLDTRDKGFVTELVYGSTRRKRALDHVVDRFLVQDPPPAARAALRLGAHQLIEMGTPPHAAVSATVEATPKRFRGLVNAVLRKVATAHAAGISYPNDAVALSYPDWMVARLREDLGDQEANDALLAMNLPARTQRREDGYVQDRSSQRVAALVPAAPGDVVLDLCAAPGGKSTEIAGRGAAVLAADLRLGRAGLVVQNAERLRCSHKLEPNGVAVVVADGTAPPFRRRTFDAVLVDAPCSGLGSLRRRPDARWRIEPQDIDNLATLQQQLLKSAADLVIPGGTLVYSVCTLTAAETTEVLEATDADLAALGFEQVTSDLWLPASDHDGMFCSVWTRGLRRA